MKVIYKAKDIRFHIRLGSLSPYLSAIDIWHSLRSAARQNIADLKKHILVNVADAKATDKDGTTLP